jgi:hypothetical protein
MKTKSAPSRAIESSASDSVADSSPIALLPPVNFQITTQFVEVVRNNECKVMQRFELVGNNELVQSGANI